MIWASVAIGGAFGSVLRYLVHMQSMQWFGSDLPYGTLIVNVVGSLLIGFFTFLFLERIQVSEELRLAVLVGFLGGLTTFSTFSFETLSLLQQGSYLSAVGNIFLSIALCISACFLGLVLARSL